MVLQIFPNGAVRDYSPSSRTYSAPKLNGDVFAVVKHAGRYEVRCWEFRGGDKVRDEVVDTFDYESVADTVARVLAEGDGYE